MKITAVALCTRVVHCFFLAIISIWILIVDGQTFFLFYTVKFFFFPFFCRVNEFDWSTLFTRKHFQTDFFFFLLARAFLLVSTKSITNNIAALQPHRSDVISLEPYPTITEWSRVVFGQLMTMTVCEISTKKKKNKTTTLHYFSAILSFKSRERKY